MCIGESGGECGERERKRERERDSDRRNSLPAGEKKRVKREKVKREGGGGETLQTKETTEKGGINNCFKSRAVSSVPPSLRGSATKRFADFERGRESEEKEKIKKRL